MAIVQISGCTTLVVALTQHTGGLEDSRKHKHSYSGLSNSHAPCCTAVVLPR